MLKKINTTTLALIVIVLGGLVALNKFYFSKKSESTFNDILVQIDSAKVSLIKIYPKIEHGMEITIAKSGDGWLLQKGSVKVKADSMAVANLLHNFYLMKTNSLAGEDKSAWKNYEVDDSAGTRIQISTTDNKTYDLVVGKFSYNPQTQGGMTYIRKSGDDKVYSLDGFLSFMVNQPFDNWRIKTIISGNAKDWNSLQFTYPGDSSFVLAKTNNTWTLNGQATDSLKVSNYLSSLEHVQGYKFVENYSPTASPIFSLSIHGNNMSAPITVNAYPADSVQKFIIHSSLNPDAYFSEENSGLSKRIFVGKNTLAE